MKIKLFSAGAIMLVWLPLLGVIVFFALKYWYVSLAALLFVFAIIGTQLEEKETKAETMESAFTMRQLARRDKRIKIIYQIGAPECNGRYSERQQKLQAIYDKLEAQDKEFTRKEINELIETRGYQGQWRNL